MPALVLHKGVVGPQVHGHGPAADRAVGDQFGGDPQVLLPGHHLPHLRLVVIGGRMTGLGALPQAIVPLGVEEPGLVEARLLKLVVHIGGEYEVVFFPHQLQKVVVDGLGRVHIAVPVDMAAPPGPVLLQGGEGVEASGIQVWNVVFFDKVPEMLLEPGAGIGKAGRGGQAGARPDDHGVSPVQGLPQPGEALPGEPGRGPRRCL